MSYLTEKAAYLRGLIEGTEIDTTTKEGKILAAVVEVLGDMADEVDEAFEAIDENQEQVDEIDEAQAEVED